MFDPVDVHAERHHAGVLAEVGSGTNFVMLSCGE
jgi:hypothetical protein